MNNVFVLTEEKSGEFEVVSAHSTKAKADELKRILAERCGGEGLQIKKILIDREIKKIYKYRVHVNESGDKKITAIEQFDLLGNDTISQKIKRSGVYEYPYAGKGILRKVFFGDGETVADGRAKALALRRRF